MNIESSPLNNVSSSAPVSLNNGPKEPTDLNKGAQLQWQLSEIMSSNDNFKTKTMKVMSVIESCMPESPELAALREFCRNPENSQKLNRLQDIGWKGLHQFPEEAKAMEDFRSNAVNHVVSVCLAAIKAMGYENPGKHSATGTPGWKSDIDTVYLPPAGMPAETQNIEKLLFDMIFFHAFNGSSGRLFDTESYLQQSGSALDTERYLESADGKAGFGRLELNAAALQMMRQCGGPDSNQWGKFTHDQLQAAAGNTNLQKALSASFRDVEGMERDIHDGINRELIENSGQRVPATREERKILAAQILAENPQEAQKLEQTAAMGFKTKALMKIGREMDLCKENISSLDQRLSKSSEDSFVHSLLKMGSKDSMHSLRMQREEATLRLGTLALLRESFFDEGYVSQGAFLKVCFHAEGQMHLREVEQIHKRIRTSSEEDLHNQLKGFPVERKVSNPQQNASSALENIAMYKGHFEKLLGDRSQSSYENAFIESSKYSERALGSSLELLKAMEKANPKLLKDDEYLKFKNELETTYAIAADLEKVKRGSVLNATATSYFLLMFLKPDTSPAQIPELKKDIAKILSRPDFKFEESLLPEQRYHAMITSLEGYITFETETKTRTIRGKDGNPKEETYQQLKFDKNGRVITNNHDVELILKARCGLDPDDVEIKLYHEHARDATLIHLDLRTAQKILAFNAKTEELTMRAYKMAVDRKLIQCPTAERSKNLSVNNVWQQVSATMEDDL